MLEFHRFFIALSVLPGIIFTMSAHLVPCSATACVGTGWGWGQGKG